MIASRPHDGADTTHGRCALYRTHFALPATVEPEADRIIVKVGAVAAITMPCALGARVKESMRSRDIPPGPVILHTRSRRWTFLLEPDLPFDDVELHAEMYHAAVTVAPLGASVALPAPSDPEDGYRSWSELPLNGFRPSAAVLIEVVRECTKIRPGGRS